MFSLLKEFIQLEILNHDFQDVLAQVTKEKDEENKLKDLKKKKIINTKKDIDILKDMGIQFNYHFYKKNDR